MTVHWLPARVPAEAVVARLDRAGPVDDDTVPSGFPSLDGLLGGGFRRRDLIVLGGDVGVGKSALALAFALRAARGGTRVVFASGEMTEERVTERALAMQGRVRIDDLRLNALSDRARAEVRAAALALRDSALAITTLNQSSFQGLVDQLAAHDDAGLVILDYLQLLPTPVDRSTQDEDLAVTLRRLKALALERAVPLLVVAQLPRHTAQRSNLRPTLDDFGALGSVKQHADVVLALYREDMYRPEPGVTGATELIVAKNRNGPTGFADLYFREAWMRFEDMLDPDR